MSTQTTPNLGPLGRGPDPSLGPLFSEGTQKGTQKGTQPVSRVAVSAGGMGCFGHKGEGTEKGTQQGTEPLLGPLVPSPSIRGEGQGTEGQTGEATGNGSSADTWTPEDTARLVLRLVREFDAELESAPAPVRDALARLAADEAIPDQLTMPLEGDV